MAMIRLLGIFFLIASLPNLAASQLIQPARAELEVSLLDDEHYIIPGGEWGLLVSQRNRKESTFKDDAYDLVLFDTLLQEQWRTQILIESKYKYRGFEQEGGKYYMLFVHEGNKKAEYTIVSIDAETSLSRLYSLKNDMAMELTEFTVLGNLVIFGGYVNYRPSVFAFDIYTEQLKVLPGLYDKNSELIEVRANPLQQSFTVLYTEVLPNRQHTISSKTYDSEANPVLEYKLQPEEGMHLLYGRTTQFSDSAVHIAGTYAPKNSDYSQGIYISSVYGNGEQSIKYYPFTELENFFVFMSEKRQKRVKQKIKRRNDQRRSLNLNYRLLVHDIVPHTDQYILLAEAFYPKYNAGGPMNLNSRGFRDASQNYLEGYKYTHAVLLGFDGSGKLLWDNGFEINEVVQPTLEKLVHVLPADDQIVLVYAYENELQTKIISNNTVLAGKESNALQLVDYLGETRDDGNGYIELHDWYGNSLYAYGEQRIKNPDGSEDNNRRVFFINKITYQPISAEELQKADSSKLLNEGMKE